MLRTVSSKPAVGGSQVPARSHVRKLCLVWNLGELGQPMLSIQLEAGRHTENWRNAQFVRLSESPERLPASTNVGAVSRYETGE